MGERGPQARRTRRVVYAAGCVVLATTALTGCQKVDEARPVVRERSWNFIGRVEHAEFGKGYEVRPKTIVMSMSPEIDDQKFTVGPATMVMTDGRSLRVPPRTPGANACVELLTDAGKVAVTGLRAPLGLEDTQVRLYGPSSKECLIIGTAHNGVVQRFAVLGSDAGLANVGALASETGDSYLTTSGYRFRLDPHVRIRGCSSDRQSPADVLDRFPANEALVDPKTETMVEVRCLSTD